MKYLTDFFTPNKKLLKHHMLLMVIFQTVVTLLIWSFGSNKLIPTPIGILEAGVKLFTEQDLFSDLMASLWLSFEAMTKTIIFSLLISYLTVIPFFRPLGFIISKLRFLTLIGLSFVFVLLTSDGHSLQVWILVFCITVFFVTSMLSVMSNIKREEFNYARTLGMNEWEVVWHVVIRSHLSDVFDVIRQNFAMAWVMLTMVEGLVRANGGIGKVLLDQNKHFQLDAVFAIQVLVLLIGMAQDKIIAFVGDVICPYAKLTLERK